MKNQEESQKRDRRLSSLTGAFKRRRSDGLDIQEYHIGDIRSEHPVAISGEAIVAGDVLAPEVSVSGLVYGYVACRRLSILPGGQVWGDVYVSSIEIGPGGKINGWISTLDAGTVDLLRAGELGEGDLPDPGEALPSAELLRQIQRSGADVEADQKLSQRRSGIWRQLRSEAALALIARSEIEATFRQRLEDELAESAEELAALREQLNEALIRSQPVTADESSSQAPVEAESQASSAELAMLQSQLHKATAAAQKYYGDLLWTRAALRAVKKEEKDS